MWPDYSRTRRNPSRPIAMNRPALITLRVLAIGSALTVLGCLVANQQKNSNASAGANANSNGTAAGDRGQPGPAAPANQTAGDEPRPRTFAPSSKSISVPLVPAQKLKLSPAQQPASSPNDPPRRFMAGTKSAAVVSPRDVTGHQSGPPVLLDAVKSQEEAKRRLSRGIGFYDLGHYPDAASEFSAALAHDPDNMAAKSWLDKTQKAMNPPAVTPAPPSNAPATPPIRPSGFAPSSKSGRPMSPADVQRFRQSVNPPAQQPAPAQQRQQ